MIKKALLGIGFILLGLISFSSAGKVQMVGIEGSPSVYDNNYQLTFLKGGGLLSSFLGQGKGVLALTDKAFFWWTPNGQPYYYDNTYQGFFSHYYLCDELTGYDSLPVNCTSYFLTGDYLSLFKGFFSSVKIEDLVYYNYEAADIGSSYYDNTIQVCWSSSEFGKSFCFMQHECYNGHGCSAGNYGSLINSQYYTDLSFSNISLSSVGPAPGQYGYGSQTGGNSESDINAITVSDNDVVNYYESVYGFNSNMCYVSTNDLDSEYGQIWQTFSSGQSSIFQAFEHLYNRLPASDGYTIIGRWIDFWIFNYNNWFNTDQNPPFLLVGSPLAELWEKTYTGFVSPFIGQPAFIYFYVNELENEGSLSFGTERYGSLIAQYCDIKLNGTNSYPLLNSSVNDIKEEKSGWWNYGDDGEYQSPTQGYNGGSSGFWDNTANTGTVAFNTSFKQFYANLSDMLSGISVTGNGVIPNYILFFLAFIILVRLLRK